MPMVGMIAMVGGVHRLCRSRLNLRFGGCKKKAEDAGGDQKDKSDQCFVHEFIPRDKFIAVFIVVFGLSQSRASQLSEGAF